MFEYICLFDRQSTPKMLDIFDNTTPLVSVPVVDYEDLSSKYDALLSFYSVRTNNVLVALRQKYDSKQGFLDAFIRMSRKEIHSLKNCGAKTIDEILAIQSVLNPTHEEQDSNAPEFIPRSLPANIDILLPLVMPRLEGLSARAKNGIIIFLEENHNSLSEMYATFTNPQFDPVKMRNVGRSTAAEVMDVLNGIGDYLESFADEKSVEDAVTKFFTKTLDDQQIPTAAQDEIHELENTLGRFPLFAALKAYIEGLEGEERSIIDGLLVIHEDQVPRDRIDVAAELGLSSERVRQKRNKLLDTLATYFASYRTLGFVNECPYNYQMRRINEDVNTEEGTDFNLNFINWVLASTFEEVTLLGDVIKTITGYYDKNHFLCLVPTGLCQYMDFNAFLEDVETRLAEKRINEEKVRLQNLINTHLKTQYCEDEMPAIETACRSILYLHYPVDVDFGQVIFKPNTRKNNPIIIEEIIRTAGHPLTLEEIYNEFIYQYPERYTEMKALRGSVNNNPNIIPIGRSSTYTLIEWEGGEQKGGSIRDIIAEYLNSLEPSIASIPDIVEYVTKFRPTTDEKNITSNISMDKSGLFETYYKDGVRCLALAGRTYPMDYFLVVTEAHSASAQSLWYPKLVQFIEANERFPFSSNAANEEIQLGHFWLKQERYYREGKLTPQGVYYHEMILNKYSHLRIDRREYEWERMYERAKFAVEAYGFEDMDDDVFKWIAKNSRGPKRHKEELKKWGDELIQFMVTVYNKQH